MSNKWWQMTAEEVVATLKANPQRGLTRGEAENRLVRFGPNRLQKKEPLSPWRLFLSEFTDFMVLVLLGAVVVSGAFGEWEDAFTILAIVLLNAILGFIQEYRAERSLEALKELSAPQARVIRDGLVQNISASEVVPGDLLSLEAGDRIAADARLLQAIGLEADESLLTGESLPVEKDHAQVTGTDAPGLGDRKNMVYAGTILTRGRGLAIVVSTGMNTELGKIAGLLEAAENNITPLQRRLDQLGRTLVLICIIVCLLVGVLGLWRGESFRVMFLSAVSLAVAAIPEGLPAIVTISLALGVQRMIKRKAIIRHLPAVETLGCANVICSDKTGTLTQNQMTVRKLFINGDEIEVTGEGFAPDGALLWRNHILTLSGQDRMKTQQKQSFFYRDPEGLRRLLLTGLYCNNSKLEVKEGKWQVMGDPTEGALLVLAAKGGIQGAKGKRLGEVAFTSERKRMSVLVCEKEKPTGACTLYVKGASDLLLELSTAIRWAGREVPLQQAQKEAVQRAAVDLAKQAMRVLGLAYKPWPKGRVLEEKAENELIFLGLVGMIDPPRVEAKEAVAVCKRAGIRTVMITGDFPLTAQAIGAELGLLRPGGLILTGRELDEMSGSELAKVVEAVDIFARVSPRHKLQVVQAFRNKGAVVAMTGDGVNDAPAVKEADIGVAMGLSGTDVTKEASDMVIMDDNFATIVAAVEEGRGIYSNIRKFIRYLLGCNIGEILTMFLASLTGLPIPLLPIQILWTNLVTDGLPAIALGVEPTEKELMNQPPRPPDEGVFSRGLGWKILIQGFTIGLMTTSLFFLAMRLGAGLREARTIAFSSLVFSQLSYVFACRSETRPLRRMK
ncbi:MAG TPA: cation-translocating P-type ATPase, partial [Bacillota bacterium]